MSYLNIDVDFAKNGAKSAILDGFHGNSDFFSDFMTGDMFLVLILEPLKIHA